MYIGLAHICAHTHTQTHAHTHTHTHTPEQDPNRYPAATVCYTDIYIYIYTKHESKCATTVCNKGGQKKSLKSAATVWRKKTSNVSRYSLQRSATVCNREKENIQDESKSAETVCNRKRGHTKHES